MANENYDELVKQLRWSYDNGQHFPRDLLGNVAKALEQLQKERDDTLRQLAHAEQRIADLQKNLARHKGCSVDQVSVSSARVEVVAKEKK